MAVIELPTIDLTAPTASGRRFSSIGLLSMPLKTETCFGFARTGWRPGLRPDLASDLAPDLAPDPGETEMPWRAATPCPSCRRVAARRDRARHLVCSACGWRDDNARGTTTERGLGADWQKVRLLVLARDSWTCQVRWDERCEQIATTVDHIIPRAQGGGLDPRLLRASCKHCNSARGDR